MRTGWVVGGQWPAGTSPGLQPQPPAALGFLPLVNPVRAISPPSLPFRRPRPLSRHPRPAHQPDLVERSVNLPSRSLPRPILPLQLVLHFRSRVKRGIPCPPLLTLSPAYP